MTQPSPIYLHDAGTPLAADSGWVAVPEGGRYNWHAKGTFNSTTATLYWADNSSGTDGAAIDGAALSVTGAILDIPMSPGWVKVDFSGTPTSVTSFLFKVG